MDNPQYHLYLRGYTGGWDFDADYVDYILAQHQGKPVNVLISSPGGSLATALRVSAAFAAHGDVHVHYVGMNASAATIAGMGAKEITIDDVGALWLVHKSSIVLDIYRQMNSADMAGLIDSLQKRIGEHEKIDAQIARMYAKRCKRSPEDLAALMAEETWLSPDEALEWGFVDSLVETGKQKADKLPESVVCAIAEAGLPELPREFRQSTLGEKISESVRAALEACGIKKVTNNKSNKEMTEQKNQQPAEAKAADGKTAENAVEAKQPERTEQKTDAQESAEIAALRAELAKANARIKELEDAPGADTTNVIENSRSSSPAGAVDELFSNLAGARNLMASVGR